MCIRVSTPPQKRHHPLFFAKTPLNLETVQAPFPPPAPLLGKYPLYIGFSSPLLPKSQMFQRSFSFQI